MALKEYCTKCGEATEYTLKKPLRCSFCGELLSSITSTASQPLVKKYPPTPIQPVYQQPTTPTESQYGTDEDGKYEIVTSVPNIQGLDVTITTEPLYKRHNMSEMVKQESTKPSPKKRGRKPKIKND
jgi:hypothetical protein